MYASRCGTHPSTLRLAQCKKAQAAGLSPMPVYLPNMPKYWVYQKVALSKKCGNNGFMAEANLPPFNIDIARPGETPPATSTNQAPKVSPLAKLRSALAGILRRKPKQETLVPSPTETVAQAAVGPELGSLTATAIPTATETPTPPAPPTLTETAAAPVVGAPIAETVAPMGGTQPPTVETAGPPDLGQMVAKDVQAAVGTPPDKQ